MTKTTLTVGSETTAFSKTCSVTGEQYSVSASNEDVSSWRSGTLIQNAMPYLDADEREFLISGTTPAEWVAMFSGEED